MEKNCSPSKTCLLCFYVKFIRKIDEAQEARRWNVQPLSSTPKSSIKFGVNICWISHAHIWIKTWFTVWILILNVSEIMPIVYLLQSRQVGYELEMSSGILTRVKQRTSIRLFFMPCWNQTQIIRPFFQAMWIKTQHLPKWNSNGYIS